MGNSIMPRFAATTLLVATLLSLPANAAWAQSEEEIVTSIETIHGDADGFFELFSQLQDAVMLGDPADIALFAFYPLTVQANGETYDVLEEQDLLDNFDALIAGTTVETILAQDVADLIVTGDGVGFGDGALWVSNVCLDDDCAETAWGIIAINN